MGEDASNPKKAGLVLFVAGGFNHRRMCGDRRPGSAARTSLQAIPASLIKSTLASPHCARGRRSQSKLAMLRAKIALDVSDKDRPQLQKR